MLIFLKNQNDQKAKCEFLIEKHIMHTQCKQKTQTYDTQY